MGERLAVAGMYVAYGQQQVSQANLGIWEYGYFQEPYRPYGPLPTTVDLAEDTITVTYSDRWKNTSSIFWGQMFLFDRIVYDNTEISGFYICQLDPPV